MSMYCFLGSEWRLLACCKLRWTCSMYPRPVDKEPEVFQLSVTNVEATVMGKIWMCSDCKKKVRKCVLHCEEMRALHCLKTTQKGLTLCYKMRLFPIIFQHCEVVSKRMLVQLVKHLELEQLGRRSSKESVQFGQGCWHHHHYQRAAQRLLHSFFASSCLSFT